MTSAKEALAQLEAADRRFAERYPGEGGARQPVHTVYGGAQLFRAQSAKKLGELGLRALDAYAPDAVSFARAVGLPGAETLPASLDAGRVAAEAAAADPETARRLHRPAWLADAIYRRVRDKLVREPVEDFRIDFEDGYGNRPDAEEDAEAGRTAKEVTLGMREGGLPPFLGIRIKPMTPELRGRSMRTLDLFLTTLARGGEVPTPFVVTLPKVTMAEEVAAATAMLAEIETRVGLAPGSVKIELMVETTQSILGPDGRCPLPEFVAAAGGRCTGAHFGTYDYTASCSITAAHQHMGHPACDFAKHVMKVALAGTGVFLSDGATNVMPVGPHRASEGHTLSAREVAENAEVVRQSWRLHYNDVQHSLVNGFYQGWDLHPAQLPTRYAAVYAFFLDGLDAAAERLRNFVDKAAQATLVGDVFDDAATGQGLLNFFLRALNSGATTEDEVVRLTSLTRDEIATRSFVKILAGRRAS